MERFVFSLRFQRFQSMMGWSFYFGHTAAECTRQEHVMGVVCSLLDSWEAGRDKGNTGPQIPYSSPLLITQFPPCDLPSHQFHPSQEHHIVGNKALGDIPEPSYSRWKRHGQENVRNVGKDRTETCKADKKNPDLASDWMWTPKEMKTSRKDSQRLDVDNRVPTDEHILK